MQLVAVGQLTSLSWACWLFLPLAGSGGSSPFHDVPKPCWIIGCVLVGYPYRYSPTTVQDLTEAQARALAGPNVYDFTGVFSSSVDQALVLVKTASTVGPLP